MKKVKLTQGKYALVDDEDYPLVSSFKWHFIKTNNYTEYASNAKAGYMHRFITKCPKGKLVDHINGNGLDNTRKNLRVCSSLENQTNSYQHRNGKLVGAHKIILKYVSGKTGVRWKSGSTKNNRHIYLGCFKTELEAHQAYMKHISKALKDKNK